MSERRCASCRCVIPEGRRYCEVCWKNELKMYNQKMEEYKRALYEYDNLPPSLKKSVDEEARKNHFKWLTIVFFVLLTLLMATISLTDGMFSFFCPLTVIVAVFGIYSTKRLYLILGRVIQICFWAIFGGFIGFFVFGSIALKAFLNLDMSSARISNDWRINLIYVLSFLLGIVGGALIGVKRKITGRPIEPSKPSNGQR